MRKHLPLLLSLAAIGSCEGVPDEDTGGLQLAVESSDYVKGIWQPKTGATWDWQLTVPVDMRAPVEIYDIDMFTATPAVISRLHAMGRKVVCYLNVGAWEEWRDDAAQFPPEILGKPWSDTKFTDEKWLDIRRIDLLSPILGARLDEAKRKGCDAIEPDNLDGYVDMGGATPDRTGFNLTAADQLKFNRWIAEESHKRGMAVALKNDPDQARELEPYFDFVVSEQCFDYNECGAYKPFADKKKAILLAEYREDLGVGYQAKFDRMCPDAVKLGISAILKKNALDAWMRACPTRESALDGGVPRGGDGNDAGRGMDAGRWPPIGLRPDAGIAPDAGRGPVIPRTPDAGSMSSDAGLPDAGRVPPRRPRLPRIPRRDAGVPAAPVDAGRAPAPSDPGRAPTVPTGPTTPAPADAGVPAKPPVSAPAEAGVPRAPVAPTVPALADAGVPPALPASADAGRTTATTTPAPASADAGRPTAPTAPAPAPAPADAGRAPTAVDAGPAPGATDAGRSAAAPDAGRRPGIGGRFPILPPGIRARADAGARAPRAPGA